MIKIFSKDETKTKAESILALSESFNKKQSSIEQNILYLEYTKNMDVKRYPVSKEAIAMFNKKKPLNLFY